MPSINTDAESGEETTEVSSFFHLLSEFLIDSYNEEPNHEIWSLPTLFVNRIICEDFEEILLFKIEILTFFHFLLQAYGRRATILLFGSFGINKNPSSAKNISNNGTHIQPSTSIPINGEITTPVGLSKPGIVTTNGSGKSPQSTMAASSLQSRTKQHCINFNLFDTFDLNICERVFSIWLKGLRKLEENSFRSENMHFCRLKNIDYYCVDDRHSDATNKMYTYEQSDHVGNQIHQNPYKEVLLGKLVSAATILLNSVASRISHDQWDKVFDSIQTHSMQAFINRWNTGDLHHSIKSIPEIHIRYLHTRGVHGL